MFSYINNYRIIKYINYNLKFVNNKIIYYIYIYYFNHQFYNVIKKVIYLLKIIIIKLFSYRFIF